MTAHNRREIDDKSQPFLVLGIVLIATGALAALVGLLGGAFTCVAGSLFFPAVSSSFSSDMSNLAVINQTQGVTMIVFGLVSVHACVAGFGLMGQKRWGRLNTMMWAASALVYLVAERMLTFMYIVPETEALLHKMLGATGIDSVAQQAARDVAKGDAVMSFSLVTTILLAALPILTLIVVPIKSRRPLPI